MLDKLTPATRRRLEHYDDDPKLNALLRWRLILGKTGGKHAQALEDALARVETPEKSAESEEGPTTPAGTQGESQGESQGDSQDQAAKPELAPAPAPGSQSRGAPGKGGRATPAAGTPARGRSPEAGETTGLGQLDRDMELFTRPVETGAGNAGIEASAPTIHAWLSRVDAFFPKSVAKVLTADLLPHVDPETILASDQLCQEVPASLEMLEFFVRHKGKLDGPAKDRARALVARIVDQLRVEFSPAADKVRGALRRDRRSPVPVARNLDFKRTLRENLKTYDPAVGSIVPERIYFSQREYRQKPWHLIVLVDQSGSMGQAAIFTSIFAAIWAGVPALETHLVAFDTSVVDLSDQLADPVDLLFGLQLGGGTDIGRAVGYAQTLVRKPAKTILVLMSDFYEGGNARVFLSRVQDLLDSGVTLLGLLPVNSRGRPFHDKALTARLVRLGMHIAACTPDSLATTVREIISDRLVR